MRNSYVVVIVLEMVLKTIAMSILLCSRFLKIQICDSKVEHKHKNKLSIKFRWCFWVYCSIDYIKNATRHLIWLLHYSHKGWRLITAWMDGCVCETQVCSLILPLPSLSLLLFGCLVALFSVHDSIEFSCNVACLSGTWKMTIQSNWIIRLTSLWTFAFACKLICAFGSCCAIPFASFVRKCTPFTFQQHTQLFCI